MRVLVLSNLYPPDVLGGFEIACEQVVGALRARGHEVLVLSSRPRTPIVEPEPSSRVQRRFDLVDEWSSPALGRHPVAIRLKLSRSRIVNAFNVHVLTQAIQEFSPDVIYVNNLVGIGGLGLLATLQYLNIPWVWHLGDYVPRELCSDLDGLIPGLAHAFAGEIRGTYAVVSERVRSECEADELGLKGRVELIPYWITGDRPPARAKFHQPGETLRIMTVGRVDRQKGSDLVIDAAARLKRAGFHHFVIDLFGKIGDSTFPGWIRSLGLDDVVKLQGPRPHREILDRYNDYDLLLFPTWSREPFGIVPLEAVARGCVPVISADCGIGEWLVDGIHCLKAARTSEAFADAIQRVARGEITLQSMARRGSEAAWRDFHLDAILPKIEALLLDAAIQPSSQEAGPPGTASEAYRLARMAEQLTQLLIQDAMSE